MKKTKAEAPKAEFVRDTTGSRQRCNDNLSFKAVSIAYYPEDQEKMATMSLKEKIDYCAYLKMNGRYTVIDEVPETPAAPTKPATALD